jgi:transcriptional regulator with XRE-family HTH domain
MHPIERERIKQRLSLRELGRRSGVPAGTISGIERGIRKPHSLTLAKLADGLGVEVEALMDLKEVALPLDIDRLKEVAIREAKPESLPELQRTVEDKIEQRYSNEELFMLKDELEEIRKAMSPVKATRFDTYAKVVETENYIRLVLEKAAAPEKVQG